MQQPIGMVNLQVGRNAFGTQPAFVNRKIVTRLEADDMIGTLVVILPTNKHLLNPALDRRSAEAGQLLARWGALHAVRSVLSALALLLLLYLLIFAKS